MRNCPGCNSVIATKTALKLSDYVGAEAGFGADLGAEKFMNIKCRKSGLYPSASVIVSTVRSMKMNGCVSKENLNNTNLKAVEKGCANLGRHIENVKSFGVPVVIAINCFKEDKAEEIKVIKNFVRKYDVEIFECSHWAEGSKGAIELAKKVVDICDNEPNNFKTLYEDNVSLIDKIQIIAKEIELMKY